MSSPGVRGKAVSRFPRVPADLGPNALALARARAEAEPGGVCDCTESNPVTAGLSPGAAEWGQLLAGAVEDGYTPYPGGLESARVAVSAYYARRGCRVEARDIFLVSGTSEGYSLLFKLLAAAGDAVLVPAPAYPLLEPLVRLEALRPEAYSCGHDGDGHWSLDWERLESAWPGGARAVVAVHPNNPTGSALTRPEARRLAEVCARNGAALIVDEVFGDFPAPSREALWSLADFPAPCPVFVMSGLSKSVGLPQLKLSWVVLAGAAAGNPALEAALSYITDAYLSVGQPPQSALPGLLSLGEAYRARVLHRLSGNQALVRQVLDGRCRILPRGAGWYSLVAVPDGWDEEALCLRLLREQGVWMYPGYFFDFPAGRFLVLSLIVPPAPLQRGLEGLIRILES